MRRFMIASALAACATSARAQVVYEHFQPTTTINSFVSSGYEVGEFVTLAGGATHIGSVDFQFASFYIQGTAGMLSLNFYADAAGSPGALISTFAQPVNLVGQGPIPLTFNAGGLAVPASVWVAVRLEQTSGSNGGVLVDHPSARSNRLATPTTCP